MGFKHATLRPRIGLRFSLQEDAVDIAFIIFNAMFVFGSLCFQESWEDWYALGDWVFIVGSVGQFLLACVLTFEKRGAIEDGLDPLSTEDNELLESFCYVLAAGVFAAGAVFYMPGVYSTEASKVEGHIIGTWLFIWGSLGLVIASYFNALGLGTKLGERVVESSQLSANDKRMFNLSALGLLCSLLGSVAFCVGSFLYRPGLSNTCERGTDKTSNEVCVSTANVGTCLYIAGSVLFLAQSLGNLYCTMLKQDRTTYLNSKASRGTPSLASVPRCFPSCYATPANERTLLMKKS